MLTNFRRQWDSRQVPQEICAGDGDAITDARGHALQKIIPLVLQNCGVRISGDHANT
jgi:hypothetical protein